MFFVCCGCFTSMSQGNLAGEGTSGARAESSVEVGGEEWEDSLVEKLLARIKEQEISWVPLLWKLLEWKKVRKVGGLCMYGNKISM